MILSREQNVTFRVSKMLLSREQNDTFFSMVFAWPREQFSILNVILNIKFILRENFAWNKMILSREQNVTFRGNKTLLFWKKFLRISWKKFFFFFFENFSSKFLVNKFYVTMFWWKDFCNHIQTFRIDQNDTLAGAKRYFSREQNVTFAGTKWYIFQYGLRVTAGAVFHTKRYP